jgi:hypothetical protein
MIAARQGVWLKGGPAASLAIDLVSDDVSVTGMAGGLLDREGSLSAASFVPTPAVRNRHRGRRHRTVHDARTGTETCCDRALAATS